MPRPNRCRFSTKIACRFNALRRFPITPMAGRSGKQANSILELFISRCGVPERELGQTSRHRSYCLWAGFFAHAIHGKVQLRWGNPSRPAAATRPVSGYTPKSFLVVIYDLPDAMWPQERLTAYQGQRTAGM